ncbi:MAG: DNA polymerase III subunit gamma/tau [Chitinophagales bacterium]
MAFVVSARKYRPQKFKEVVGQSSVTTTLKNALKNDKLAQSFLFCGPRGVGKTTCARILAKVINCKNVTEDTEPCGTCSSCTSFNESASFNIFELDAASNNSVDDIRNLIEQVRFAPQAGKYKVYIIDEVHMLSQAAFNAFLKTLEEPPPYAIFILATTEKHKIIPTILSRCQIFDFSRIKVSDTVEHLQTICEDKGIEAEQDALHIIAQKADGALRDALSIFDRVASFTEGKIEYQKILHTLNVLDYDYYFQLTDALLSQDHATALVLYDEILQKGFDGDIFISGLASHFRDLLVCKDAKTLQLLEVTDNLKNRYAQQANITTGSFLLTALNIANQCEINYKSAKNKRLQVELTLVKMCYLMAAIDLSKEAKTVTHLSAAPRVQMQGSTTNSNIRHVETQKPKIQTQSSNANVGKVQTPKVEHTNTATSKSITPKIEEPEVVYQTTPSIQKEEKQKVIANPKPITPVSAIEESKAQEIKPLKRAAEHKTPKSPSIKGTSIDAIRKKNRQKKEEQQRILEAEKKIAEEKANMPKVEISEQTLQNLWSSFGEKLDNEKSKGLFKGIQPKLNEKKIYVIVAANTQKKIITEQSHNFLKFLNQKLGKTDLTVHIEVDKNKAEEQSNNKFYTPVDRFKKMVEDNPALKEMQQRLDLDIQY